MCPACNLAYHIVFLLTTAIIIIIIILRVNQTKVPLTSTNSVPHITLPLAASFQTHSSLC